MEAGDNTELCQDVEAIAFENESFMLRTSMDDDDTDNDIDDEDSQDGEEQTFPVIRSQIFPPLRMTLDDADDEDERDVGSVRACLASRSCSVCLYIVLVLIILCSFILLVVVSLLVAAPYIKAAGFQPTHCHSIALEYLEDEERCSCGKGCNSNYPCIVISINFTDTSNASFVTKLANDETHLHQKCSYYPHCSSSQPDNTQKVTRFAQLYGGLAANYTCLYNPSDPLEVIRRRRFRPRHVIHGLLWSSFLLIMAVCFLILLFRYRGCDVSNYDS